MIESFLSFERGLNRLVTALAIACLAVAVACGAYQVLARFVLSIPSVWSETLVRVALIWMVFLGAMAAFRQGALVCLDFVYRRVPPGAQALIRVLILACGVASLAVMLYAGVMMVIQVRNQDLAGLEIPIAYVYAAIPVGAAFALLGAVAHFLAPPAVELELNETKG
jgi:TRAP-type C4-dicarboxylate transport system permease small subunit